MTTVTLSVTTEQIIQLIEQLPEIEQQSIYEGLSRKTWARWWQATRRTEMQARLIASERGLVWEALTETEQEAVRAESRQRAAARLMDRHKESNLPELTPEIEQEIVDEVRAARAERRQRNATGSV